MKRTNDIITRYEHGEYYIDIVDTAAGETEAWICKKDHTISTYMYGMEKDQTPREEFLDLVEENLDDYIDIYEMDLEKWREI